MKPAWEPIIVARKPLEGTVAENVLKYGTGAMNIGGSRVGVEARKNSEMMPDIRGKDGFMKTHAKPMLKRPKPNVIGRFPANLIHDGSEKVVNLFPANVNPYAGKSGSASRFFYCAKASKVDRDEGCEYLPIKRPDERTSSGMGSFEEKGVLPGRNFHPTVKPTELMKYLIKLVCRPGGIVLDPFMGSGSTLKAAILEGYDCVGIDNNPEYVEIAVARCKKMVEDKKSANSLRPIIMKK